MGDYRRFSLWLDLLDEPLQPRAPLEGTVEADVAIVGAGYTGLWTAYYILKAAPEKKVVVVEKEIAGYGASGRNGGWCSALFAASWDKIARSYGRSAAIALQKQMFDTVDEVGRVCNAEGIECDYFKSGTLTLVTSPMQIERVREHISEAREWGFEEDDYRWLTPQEASARLAVSECHGAVFTPHCARIQPAKLARGLARTVEQMGATIYERSAVSKISPREVATDRGSIRAPVVVRATEGYTSAIDGFERTLVPLYSMMIATEPLGEDVWRSIGWRGYETIHDGRHLLIYAQRTADDRIAIGGRGAPYRFSSGITEDFVREEGRTFAALKETLTRLFPATERAAVTHRWGGVLGVPRDWFSSVGYDPATGLAWSGGYVGDGVATANLGGRTLADLILGRDTAITRLPWVGHRSRSWEPEPLRWLGINAALRVMGSADRREARTGRPSRRGRWLRRAIGL